MPLTQATLGERKVSLEISSKELQMLTNTFNNLSNVVPAEYIDGGRELVDAYGGTLRMDKGYSDWADFVSADKPRDGFSLAKRFKGWAASHPFPAVLFWSIPESAVVKLIYVDEVAMTGIVLGRKGLYVITLESIFPIFPSKLRGISKSSKDKLDAAQVVIDNLARELTNTHTPDKKVSFDEDPFEHATPTKQPVKTEKETKMKNMNKKAANLLQVEKDAAVQTGYLTAGRTSNKLVKEAVRPILNLIFKPNFMQRLAIKWGGVKNPVDSFMESPASDVVCSRLFRVLLELKGVEDERVLNAANAAIVYSNMKVGEELPIEELIDSAIAKVSEGVESLDLTEKVKRSLK